MKTVVKKNTSGFTLVEVIISLIILTVAALGITQFLISIQYTAEDNLYESTAFNVALNTLEQMKNTPETNLEQSIAAQTFNLVMSADRTITLNLGQANGDIEVPIFTDDDVTRSIPITLTPDITFLGGGIGYLFRVEYEYRHPRNDRARTEVISCIRSKVPTF